MENAEDVSGRIEGLDISEVKKSIMGAILPIIFPYAGREKKG
jgi:hypothetical protein